MDHGKQYTAYHTLAIVTDAVHGRLQLLLAESRRVFDRAARASSVHVMIVKRRRFPPGPGPPQTRPVFHAYIGFVPLMDPPQTFGKVKRK